MCGISRLFPPPKMAAGQRKETIRVKWKLAACHHLSVRGCRWTNWVNRFPILIPPPDDVSFLFTAPVLGQFSTGDHGRLIGTTGTGKKVLIGTSSPAVPVYYEFFPPPCWGTWFEMEMERLENYDLALLADVTFCKFQTFEQERGNWINYLELIFLQEIVWNFHL